jgi:hypothetical protein
MPKPSPPGQPPRYSREAPSEPEDARHGSWSHDELLKMDAKFCAAMAQEHGSRPDPVNGHGRQAVNGSPRRVSG